MVSILLALRGSGNAYLDSLIVIALLAIDIDERSLLFKYPRFQLVLSVADR